MFHRLRDYGSRWLFDCAVRGITGTRPIACDPAAACTLHTMLGAADFTMYLLGVKSLLRFGVPVRVTIHNDGSLSKRHIELLRQHVPGCRIVGVEESNAAAEAALGRDTFLFRTRGMDINYRRLIDTELLNETPKRIIMDADVLVLKRPAEDRTGEWRDAARPVHGGAAGA